MTTDVNMGTKNLTCGAINCSTLTCGTLSYSSFTSPIITGSTTVNQTAATLPTTGAQIGFLLKAKLSGLQANTGWLITTSAAAISNIAYTIPAIGVWMCVFESDEIIWQMARNTGDWMHTICSIFSKARA